MLTPAGTSLESNRFHQWFSTNLSSDVYKFKNIYTDAPWPWWWWCLPCILLCLKFVCHTCTFSFFLYTGKAEASGSMHVTLCDYIMPWDSLSTTQKKSLSQRYQMGCDCKVRQQRAAFACTVYLVAWRKKKTAIHFLHYTSRHSRANKTRHDSGEQTKEQ